MNKRINIIIIVSIIFVVFSIGALKAQIKISRNVFGNGIGNLTNGSQNIHSITGQTLTGISKNQIYTSEVGFWYAAYRVVTEVTNPQDLLPVIFELFQNYPNPFNPTTMIRYSIPQSSFVNLKVYDILGREVATLVNEEKQPGQYEIEFNAYQLFSGIYFYRLHAGSFIQAKKMILLK
jgi:Secretion system C-terminal sorting domain